MNENNNYKIKTGRKKVRNPTFTKIINSYKKYGEADFIWKNIFNVIDVLKEIETSKIFKTTSEKYG